MTDRGVLGPYDPVFQNIPKNHGANVPKDAPIQYGAGRSFLLRGVTNTVEYFSSLEDLIPLLIPVPSREGIRVIGMLSSKDISPR